MPLPLVLVVVVVLSLPTLKALKIGIPDAIGTHTGIFANTVLGGAVYVPVTFWAEMPLFHKYTVMYHNSLLWLIPLYQNPKTVCDNCKGNLLITSPFHLFQIPLTAKIIMDISYIISIW